MAVYMVLFGLNFGQNRPFFALQKSNFGFAFENERTVRDTLVISQIHLLICHRAPQPLPYEARGFVVSPVTLCIGGAVLYSQVPHPLQLSCEKQSINYC